MTDTTKPRKMRTGCEYPRCAKEDPTLYYCDCETYEQLRSAEHILSLQDALIEGVPENID